MAPINLFNFVGGVQSLEEEVTGTGNSYIAQNARQVCNALATNPSLTTPGNKGFRSNRLLAQSMCGDYYQQEAGSALPEPIQLTGGQCVCTNYQISYSYDRGDGMVISSSTQRRGPLRFIQERSPNGKGLELRVVYGDPSCTGGAGNARVFNDGGNFSGPVRLTALSVAPVGGGADDCGDTDPVQPDLPGIPSVPVGSPRTVPTDDGDITVTVDVDPVTGSPVTVFDDVEFSFDPSFSGESGGSESGPSQPLTEGAPVEPDGASGDVDAPEPPEGSETIGYKWELLGLPSGGSRIPGTSPVVFPSTVGNVQLRMELSAPAPVFSDQLRILVQSGIILRQEPSFKVSGVRFNHLPDFGGIRLTPLYAQVEAET